MNTVKKAKALHLMMFTAKWCPQCPSFKKQLDAFLAEEANPDITVRCVDVDANQGQGLASAYGVMSLPTLLIFEQGHAAPKGQMVGTFRPDQIISHLLK